MSRISSMVVTGGWRIYKTLCEIVNTYYYLLNTQNTSVMYSWTMSNYLSLKLKF